MSVADLLVIFLVFFYMERKFGVMTAHLTLHTRFHSSHSPILSNSFTSFIVSPSKSTLHHPTAIVLRLIIMQ